MCGYFKTVINQKGTCPGDQFTDSLNQSVTATVEYIEGKVRNKSYGIVNIVEDFKTQRSPAVK